MRDWLKASLARVDAELMAHLRQALPDVSERRAALPLGLRRRHPARRSPPAPRAPTSRAAARRTSSACSCPVLAGTLAARACRDLHARALGRRRRAGAESASGGGANVPGGASDEGHVAGRRARAGEPGDGGDRRTRRRSVDGKTAPVFDYDQAIRERVYIPNGQDADLDGVEDRTAIEIMRPRTHGRRCPRSSRRARTTRRAAASSSASASATSTATGQRPLAALVRQLLRPARVRGDPRRDGRHRELHRLRGQRRAERRALDQGRRRLAQRPRARLQVGHRHGRPGHRALAHRQVGDDRPLLQRHAAQRRRGDRRRGADDDRPDQRDLLLVRLLADGRRDRLHALSGVPLELRHRRQPARALRADPGHAERRTTATPTAR